MLGLQTQQDQPHSEGCSDKMHKDMQQADEMSVCQVTTLLIHYWFFYLSEESENMIEALEIYFPELTQGYYS